jgi:hypothetical protein
MKTVRFLFAALTIAVTGACTEASSINLVAPDAPLLDESDTCRGGQVGSNGRCEEPTDSIHS